MQDVTNTNQDITFQIQQLSAKSIEICRGNPTEGVKLAEEIIALAQSESETAIGLACKGSCIVWLGNYDIALQALFEALPKLQDLDNK